MSEDFNSLVEDRLKGLLKLEKQRAPTTEAKLLLNRLQNLVMRGGKRMRPKLLYMTYLAYSGKQTKQLVDLAVALELHHQFLLIHDDLIDDDIVRYFEPNITGYYKTEYGDAKQRIPEAMALLAGDLVFSLANQIILDSDQFKPSLKVELLNLLHATNKVVIYGQQLDTINIDQDISNFDIDRLELINSLKTATYTTKLPMQAAAALLNLAPAERRKIDKFALPFGILFQLVDDYSDYFVNKSLFGNGPKYRDFRQGKITYPLFLAFRQGSTKDISALKQLLGHKGLKDQDIKKVVNILEDCGAKKQSTKFLETYFKECFIALDKLTLDEKTRRVFFRLIESYRV